MFKNKKKQRKKRYKLISAKQKNKLKFKTNKNIKKTKNLFKADLKRVILKK